MSRYFIHLAYNGAAYCGWQTQPDLPTVQQTLEQALTTLLRQPTAVVGCGRTDTGVHASDFYAHFDYPSEADALDTGQLTFKLNSFLPNDIAIYRIFPVADNAHARFDAVARTYQYHVSNLRLPFRQGLYCRIYFQPDIDRMNEAARVLMEYDDFTSFAKLHTQVKTNICHLTEAHWDMLPIENGTLKRESTAPNSQLSILNSQLSTLNSQLSTLNSQLSTLNSQFSILNSQFEYVFTIRSNRFLRNMVRSVTGTLLDVGRGKLSIDRLREIIERKDRCAAGVSMPAQGLFLTRVEYPRETKN